MERADKGLWSALRRVAQPEKPLDLLIAVWPLMVGRRLAAHTRPVSWNKGRVHVAVENPEWRRQLEGLGQDVQKQINRWWGTDLVHEVRFVLARSASRSTRDSRRASAERSEASRETGAQASSAANRAAADKLSAALKELEPALRGIADDELRDLIGKVAAQYLGKPSKK